MQEQVIETVMLELLEEEKIANDRLAEIKNELGVVAQQIDSFKKYVTEIKLMVPPIDTRKLDATIFDFSSKNSAEINTLKLFIKEDRKRQTTKEIFISWLGWILLILVLIVLLIVVIKWRG